MNYELLAKKTKEKIEDDFLKIGDIKNPTRTEDYLIVSAIKAIRLTDAIFILCKESLIDESLPVLRSLIEHSVNMRWIMNKNTQARLKEYLSDLDKVSKGRFGGYWTTLDLWERAKEIGFPKEYYDYVIKVTYVYSHVNAFSLHGTIIKKRKYFYRNKFSDQAVYSIVVQMLSHIMQALNIRFREFFDGFEQIRSKIKVDTNIREKLEGVKNKKR